MLTDGSLRGGHDDARRMPRPRIHVQGDGHVQRRQDEREPVPARPANRADGEESRGREVEEIADRGRVGED